VPLVSVQLLQMCTDLHDFWYTTVQLNTNHIGILLHWWVHDVRELKLKECLLMDWRLLDHPKNNYLLLNNICNTIKNRCCTVPLL